MLHPLAPVTVSVPMWPRRRLELVGYLRPILREAIDRKPRLHAPQLVPLVEAIGGTGTVVSCMISNHPHIVAVSMFRFPVFTG